MLDRCVSNTQGQAIELLDSTCSVRKIAYFLCRNIGIIVYIDIDGCRHSIRTCISIFYIYITLLSMFRWLIADFDLDNDFQFYDVAVLSI